MAVVSLAIFDGDWHIDGDGRKPACGKQNLTSGISFCLAPACLFGTSDGGDFCFISDDAAHD